MVSSLVRTNRIRHSGIVVSKGIALFPYFEEILEVAADHRQISKRSPFHSKLQDAGSLMS